MSGARDLPAPLPALADACHHHGALLAVDDAHGIGVLGANGGGSLEHFGLSAREVPALVGTLGKAFGSFGAFVAGDAALIETLVQRARTYIYTTALPVAVAAATLAALEVSLAESWRRERVLALTRRFRSLTAAAGLALGITLQDRLERRIGEPGHPGFVGPRGDHQTKRESDRDHRRTVHAVRGGAEQSSNTNAPS